MNTWLSHQIFLLHCPGFAETKPFEAVEGKAGSSSGSWDKAKSNEVSVTFTLSAAAAKVFTHEKVFGIYLPGRLSSWPCNIYSFFRI